MEIKLSVIIPTYNRWKQVMITLASFETQTLPTETFEVIVIDDGSTDLTEQMMEEYGHRAPYNFTFQKLENRSGAGAARNLGVRMAKGENIIFCDADFLVLPHFLETHLRLLDEYPLTVVSGTPFCFEEVYTIWYKEFAEVEQRAIRRLLNKNNRFTTRKLNFEYELDIITPDMIRNQFILPHRFLSKKEIVSDELKEHLLDFRFAPWLIFITRNVSVPKTILMDAGEFDARFKRGQDWELGYRIYKKGYKFISTHETIGYHQRHPVSYRKPFAEFTTLFIEKHGSSDPDVRLLGLWNSSDELFNNIIKFKTLLHKTEKEKMADD